MRQPRCRKRRWNSAGYDCSGSVSYVMHAAGLLPLAPLDSTGFMRWGGGGGGSWVRIYANHEHVLRPTGGFRLRHPLGLEHATPLS